MSDLSDRTLDHLRQVVEWPDLSQTRYELRRELDRGGMGSRSSLLPLGAPRR